jgi:hypothetical protein
LANGLKERFERRILKSESGCWLWTGAHGSSGYGHIGLNGKVLDTHRVSFELYRHRIPDGLFVLHHCDVKSCVNPEHLFLGTQTENLLDMTRKGRRSWASGENSGSAKLTAEKARKIREDTRSHRTIAKEYEIGKSTVGAIKTGKAWRAL